MTKIEQTKPTLKHWLSYHIVLIAPIWLLSREWFQDAFLPNAGVMAYMVFAPWLLFTVFRLPWYVADGKLCVFGSLFEASASAAMFLISILAFYKITGGGYYDCI